MLWRWLFGRVFDRHKLPHPRPAAGGGALFDQIFFAATRWFGYAECPAFDKRRELRLFRRRNVILNPLGECLTKLLDRADGALRISRRANRRTRVPSAQLKSPTRLSFGGEDFFGSLPEFLAGCGQAGVGLDRIDPAEHARDVAVQDQPAGGRRRSMQSPPAVYLPTPGIVNSRSMSHGICPPNSATIVLAAACSSRAPGGNIPGPASAVAPPAHPLPPRHQSSGTIR